MNTHSRFFLLAAIVLFGLMAGVPKGRAAVAGSDSGNGPSTQPSASAPAETATAATPAERIAATLQPPDLRQIAQEVLTRNPEIAAARQRALAAAERAPQVRALPDPMAAITPYILSPETRVGPQQAMVSLTQRFPWFGKLHLREQAALFGAAAARADVEAEELDLITETRRLWYELRFLDQWGNVIRSDRDTLQHYEELSRTRYASGVGLEQSVIKLQAEITKDENRLIDIESRRATLVASLNALRDAPTLSAIETAAEATVDERSTPIEIDHARSIALARRPEIARAEAEIRRAEAMIELAKKESLPDVTVGLGYTFVGPREDAPGRASPPPGNGNDILGVTAGVNLPIWRKKTAAGVEEAVRQRSAAEDAKRAVVARIDQSLGDLTQRIDLTRKQIDLFENVLTIQAEQSLQSAEAAYTAGTLHALDLLDAERVLLDVRTSTARARADLRIAIAKLEGAIASPIGSLPLNGETHD